ncbi:ABC transporter permease [Cytophagaceae bacterium ABcell3]|nr:ABC transporter permease [Cytophagaceae bacterium ABcell3]
MGFRKLTIISTFSILLLYGIIIISVFFYFDGQAMVDSFTNRRIINAITNSLYAATLATILASALAIPAAYALSRFSFPLKFWVDTFLEFPLIVSPAALGAMLLIFFQTPAGSFITENIVDFVFVFAGIVLAQFVTIIGISTRLMKAVYDEVPKRYEQVARTLGASHQKAFLTVTFPLAKKGLISTVILTWAKAVGEFGATITLAGSMPMKTETLPTAIFMRLSVADIEGTVVLILILLGISLSLLIVTRLLLLRK